jgi:preprotein translocase subunit SecG
MPCTNAEDAINEIQLMFPSFLVGFTTHSRDTMLRRMMIMLAVILMVLMILMDASVRHMIYRAEIVQN